MNEPLGLGANAIVIRDLNTRLVTRALKNARSATVRDLATATGLSTVTVGSVLQNLLASGVAQEAALVPSAGGRPSRQYRFNENQALVLVLFTREWNGTDRVCLRVADLYGRIVDAQDRDLSPDSLEDFEPPIDDLLVRYPSIRALGLGLPGVEWGGKIVALDYRNLVGTSVLDHFRNRYGLPVVFENDVNAAVLGRGRRPGAADSEVYLYFPQKYSPGAGIRIEGRLLKGHHHFAGEVGHLPLDLPWGNPGLIESREATSDAVARVVASLSAILDPESVVLFGEFLTPADLGMVEEKCRALVPSEMVPRLSLAEDFTQDFQDGLVGLTLELLESS